jgi:hypothetical protein
MRIRQRGVVVHDVQRPRGRRMRGARSSAGASHARHGSSRSSTHGRAVSAAQRISGIPYTVAEDVNGV